MKKRGGGQSSCLGRESQTLVFLIFQNAISLICSEETHRVHKNEDKGGRGSLQTAEACRTKQPHTREKKIKKGIVIHCENAPWVCMYVKLKNPRGPPTRSCGAEPVENLRRDLEE